MKRWALLLLALWAAPGCVGLDAWLRDQPAPPTDSAPLPRPRVRVNPEDVTEQNARQALDALRDELDMAGSDQRLAPVTPRVGGGRN